MCESICQDHINANIKLETALEQIKEICIYYTEKGWALNPDKIEEIIDIALND